MLAVLHLGQEAFGMRIRQEIERRARRSVSIGAAYSTLDRLEGKGYLSSRRANPAEERRGRARRYFKLEPAGTAALSRSRQILGSMWEGIDLAGDSPKPR